MSRSRVMRALLLLSSLAIARPAFAQSAAVEGRAVDDQQAAIPGVLISLVRRDTGLARETTTDSQGAFRITGVPPGAYDIRASIDGFATVEQRDTIVDVSAIVRANFTMRVASVTETVAVTAASPLVQVASATVGGVVDERRIQELPLNGRQFANLAATLPGVGVGFHRDPTKSSEYMPQVGGGNGRNVNYVVDGAENVDDTVGGLLQLFPLEAIAEFKFSLASYGAEHGRGSGGILSVVTKSGTNRISGSGFTFGRNEALNTRTTTEEGNGVSKSDYRRWLWRIDRRPIVAGKAHFFGAGERIQQDTFQPVNTQGLAPSADGVFPVAYRENLLTAKATVNASARDRITVRDAANTNSQPQDVGPLIASESWGDSRNRFHSLNGSWGRVLGTRAFNELIAQYSSFDNSIDARTDRPLEAFQNGVVIGHARQAPQTTQQRQFQIRDDVAWHLAGRFGIAHDLKTGGTFTREPHLGSPGITIPAGYLGYSHLTDDRAGPIGSVGGNPGTSPIGETGYNIPLTRYGMYIQDDWRATSRLTINAGVRYDLAPGFQIDQSRNPNFLVVQQAAQAGRFKT